MKLYEWCILTEVAFLQHMVGQTFETSLCEEVTP